MVFLGHSMLLYITAKVCFPLVISHQSISGQTDGYRVFDREDISMSGLGVNTMKSGPGRWSIIYASIHYPHPFPACGQCMAQPGQANAETASIWALMERAPGGDRHYGLSPVGQTVMHTDETALWPSPRHTHRTIWLTAPLQ